MYRKNLVELAIGLALVSVLLGLVLTAMPINSPMFFNYDESIELTRVHLLQRNYLFYQEVWSDHPLGFTRYFQFFGNFIKITLPSARYFVLLLSAINLLIFYSLLRVHCDRLSATIASLILISSYRYITLSASAINELPALTFVTLAFLLMYLYSKHQGKFSYLYLFLCSLIFAFSLEVKLSGLTALPSLVAIGVSKPNQWSDKVKDAAIWLGAFGAIFLIFSATFFPFSYYHFIALHGQASDKIVHTTQTLSALIEGGFKHDTIYTLVAILSCAAIFWSRNRSQFLPPLLLLTFNLLRFYRTLPVWANYYIHLVLPAAWLIGLMLTRFNWPAVGRNLKERKFNFSQTILPTGLILALLAQFTFNTYKITTARQPRRYRHPLLASYNMKAREYQPHSVEAFLQPYQGSHKMILTDNPYYIHKFELDTPPETAILSQKRVNTEDLDGNFLLGIIQKRNPDFVLLDRFVEDFTKSEALMSFLQANYIEHSLQDSQARFFIAKD